MLLIIAPVLFGQGKGPGPGDIYKEYILNLKTGNNWRVTDPVAPHSGAQEFLPNPVMTIQVNDLDGAIRAEALMDIWGGHTGTIGKQFRFNNKSWIDIPDHPTIEESPECFNSEFNFITEVPLSHLQEGSNEFEGTSGGQTCFNFNWGQWGWYVMLIRIYYGPEKLHPTGDITSHTSGSDVIELDTIIVEAHSPSGVKQVDLMAKYLGYDENGDGLYTDWHRNYHTTVLEGHIGSVRTQPYKFVWENQWIPDQEDAAISFMARIQDSNNVWFVTDIADSISLVRPDGISVKMFTAENIPKKFWVRSDEKKSCNVIIDDLTYATNAMVIHRTWNGQDGGAGSGTIENPLIVNSWEGKVGGVSHNYALSSVKVPVNELIEGNNNVAYHSNTSHHGIEILWPGPAILVRYIMNAAKVETPVIDPASGEYKMPVEISISCETAGAEIYYTTDGTEPNIGSKKYIGPFSLDDSGYVKAMASRFEYLDSEIVYKKYISYQYPRLVRASKGAISSTIEVDYNKPVDKITAEDLFNYSLNNSGIIINATLDPDNEAKVVLTVEGMVEGDEYTVAVNNVLDNTGMSFNSTAIFTYAYIIEISSSGADKENIAENTMDRDQSTYWSANGTSGVWIQYDLRTMRLIRSVDIAFFLGDQRNSYFSIQISADGINWSEVYNGESSGNTLEPEEFDIDDMMARYVRILGLGNSSSTNWKSYTEVQINWQWETHIPEYQLTELNIYPVPAVDEIRVGLPSSTENAEIFFINSFGQIYPSLRINGSSRLSTNNLETGIYLLICKTENRKYQEKIIVVKE